VALLGSEGKQDVKFDRSEGAWAVCANYMRRAPSLDGPG